LNGCFWNLELMFDDLVLQIDLTSQIVRVASTLKVLHWFAFFFFFPILLRFWCLILMFSTGNKLLIRLLKPF
jgi:hypothetical protein